MLFKNNAEYPMGVSGFFFLFKLEKNSLCHSIHLLLWAAVQEASSFLQISYISHLSEVYHVFSFPESAVSLVMVGKYLWNYVQY